MNKLPNAKRAAIVRALVDGASLRAVARMIGVDRKTVDAVLREVGEFAEVFQRHALVNLRYTKRIELDEIWSFCGAKEANKTTDEQGDLWTYTAIDADSKLVFSWLVAKRSGIATSVFCDDVARRLPNRVQVTTDGDSSYRQNVEVAFNYKVDFGQIIKQYGTIDPHTRGNRSRSSIVKRIDKSVVCGNPDVSKISTSFVERQNLQMRMSMRRFTRLTNGFSKKGENHALAVALHYLVYNYVRPHGTLTKELGRKTTPAMRAGCASHPWTVEEILDMVDGTCLVGKAA